MIISRENTRAIVSKAVVINRKIIAGFLQRIGFLDFFAERSELFILSPVYSERGCLVKRSSLFNRGYSVIINYFVFSIIRSAASVR